MTIMAIISILLVVALIVTVVKIAQHKYHIALGTFGVAMVVIGIFFYAQEWRARAYEVIGDPIPLDISASAGVYNGIAVMGMLLLALAGVMSLLQSKRAQKGRKRSPAAGKPSSVQFASDEEMDELLGASR